MDRQRGASQCYPGHVAFAGDFGRSNKNRYFQTSRHGYRASDGCGEHHRCVFAVCFFGFTHTMDEEKLSSKLQGT
jgi:hypothetical protein